MNYLFPFFVLFLASGMYLWLLGEAFLSPPRRWDENVLRAPWMGWAVLLGALQVIHLFAPLNKLTATAFLIASAGVAAMVLLLRMKRARPPMTVTRVKGERILLLVALGVSSLLAFWPVFNACTKEMTHYDFGLYYLKTIRWMAGYPIVPGLANLQGHLGFNQAGFLTTALLDALLPERRGVFLIGGILPWIGLASASFSLLCLGLHALGRLGPPRPMAVAYACSLPVWIYTFLNENISSGSPNLTLACVMIHLFLVFSCFLFCPDEREANLSEILLIGAACLCVKLTSLGFVFGIWAIATVIMLRQGRWRTLLDRRVFPSLAIGAALLGVWLCRGIILSGYPLFPTSFLAMPVEWRVPEFVMKNFQNYILLWARFPHGDAATALQSLGWIPHWIARAVPNQYQFAWPIQIGIAGALALSLFQANWHEILSFLRRVLVLVAPVASFAVLWFATAPDARYFGPAAWLIAMSPALRWVSGNSRQTLVACVSILCLSALPTACFTWENRWTWITRERVLPRIPVVELEVATNRHGLATWYAKEGNKSFDAPLPSSWGFTPDLSLLEPDEGLAGGFKHVGAPVVESKTKQKEEPATSASNIAPRARSLLPETQ